MSGTNTTRMGLYKPASGDFVNVATDLNNNWDKIDANLGFASCTSSTRPTTVWAGLCIFETNTNNTYVSNGTAPSSASWILIPNGGSAGNFTLSGSGVGSQMLTSKINTDTNPRYVLNADGKMNWSAGVTSAIDTNLYRSAADNLKTDDTLEAVLGFKTSGTVNISGASSGANLLTIGTSGETYKRFTVDGGGNLAWGDGGASSPDTNLYRDSTNSLTTDDSLNVGGDLIVSGVGAQAYTTASSNRSVGSTAFNAVTGMSLPVAANRVYIFKAVLYISGTNTSDLKLSFSQPTGAVTDFTGSGLDPTVSSGVTGSVVLDNGLGATGTSGSVFNTYGVTSTSSGIAVHGRTVMSGTAGNLALLCALSSGSSACSINAKSYIVMTCVS